MEKESLAVRKTEVCRAVPEACRARDSRHARHGWVSVGPPHPVRADEGGSEFLRHAVPEGGHGHASGFAT